ncbi:hypothetical protein [Nostoc sp. CHAB 5715]|uniref:hypothetical protein n=1 Tax=Nostoc sp. CHAB 5715 TaxID=2780400 RepID=UPI001E2C3513|nr:hypothetical protein [Nostoc sp. CHAB 5715]
MSWWVLGLADGDLAHIYFTCDGVGDEGGAIFKTRLNPGFHTHNYHTAIKWIYSNPI